LTDSFLPADAPAELDLIADRRCRWLVAIECPGVVRRLGLWVMTDVWK
jgi:hypothetical protein